MKPQSNIIAFCYLYILGLAAAMLFPSDPGHHPVLVVATGLALVVAASLLAGRAMRIHMPLIKPERWRWWWLPAMAVAALLLGYTRYSGADTVADMRIGHVRLAGAASTLRLQQSLPDTSRLKLEKTTPLARDVTFRLVGELDARQSAAAEPDRVDIDQQGRWQFQIVRTPIVSDVITIPAGDPVGTHYVIDQPFTRITGIEWVDGPEEGELALHRISNHIGSFVRPGRAQSPVTVLARITSDPRVYDFKTVLIVTPSYVQYPAGGPFYRVEGGDIQVTVPTNLTGYTELARTESYGADVLIRGELTVARAEANPGGFNARKFMSNYNIFGLINVFQPRDADPPMYMVKPDGVSARPGNPLVALSLDLRDRVLLLFKETMPYPQSAFLGGVTLGLRYGLQGTEYPGRAERPEWMGWLGLQRSENLIADDFRASGVNHVLAVSGLHVTIITAMFTAIFGLLRFPRKVFVPFVILALVVFAIITGARPSTLRAVIMNGLFLLTWAYLDRSLLSSVMLGVPVAAFIILLHNPLVVVDPSFTLSFGAILSLALLTMPVHEILCGLRGNRFMAVVLLTVATTLIGARSWALVTAPAFLAPWLLLCVALYWVAGELDRRGWGVKPSFAFSAMPESFSTFLAAQVAIQVGMMIPLSAYYFCRWPFGGAYANLIAIPLIGVVVQLGAIAGLLGLIPVAGPFIALVLNAANWLFTTFFLWLAHVFALGFPYPIVRRPREVEVLVYYLLVALFVWRKPLMKWLTAHAGPRLHPRAAMGLLAVAATVPLWVAPPRDTRPPGLHVTVLSVGYGSSILVESPGGKRILVDAGYVEYERGRRNEADRTILPFLSTMGIRSLDGLILTSPLPERSAGAPYLLEQLRVGHVIVPPVLEGISRSWTPDDLEARLGGAAERGMAMYEVLVRNPEWPRRPTLAGALARRADTPANRWAGWVVKPKAAAAGTALFEETVDGKTFRIEVLHAGEGEWAERRAENSGLALRVVYGDFAMLLPGSLHYAGQKALAERWSPEQLKSQVLVVPHHGAAIPGRSDRPPRDVVERALREASGPLLDEVRPELAVAEFGSPRPVLGDFGRTAINVLDLTRMYYTERLGDDAWLSTDRDMAITIHSDGATYQVETWAERHRSRGGEDDAVSDLAVGL